MSKVIKLHKKDFPVNLIEAIYRVKFESKQREEYFRLYKDRSKSDLGATLNYVLGRLEERDEKAVRMRYCDALTYAEIARRLDVSPSRVQQIIIVSLKRIRTGIPQDVLIKGVKEYYAEKLDKERVCNYEIGKNEAIAAFKDLEPDAREKFLAANKSPFYDMPFDEFADRYNLSVRLRNCINRCNRYYDAATGWHYFSMSGEKAFNTVGDITKITEEQAMTIRNLGDKAFKELKEALKKAGLSFRKEQKQ